MCRAKAVLRGAALLVWMAGAAAVEGQQYRFHYYGTEDGLTNLAVKVLFQDRTGFLWAATENGLFRYDGQRFRHYGSVEGLPRDVILSLGEAPDGSLLVGTRAGLYQQKGEGFEKLALPGAGVVDGYSGIQCDGKGRTYIATDKGLLMAREPVGDSHLSFSRGRPGRRGRRRRAWIASGTGRSVVRLRLRLVPDRVGRHGCVRRSQRAAAREMDMHPPRRQRRSLAERQAALRSDAPRKEPFRHLGSHIAGDCRIGAVRRGCRR